MRKLSHDLIILDFEATHNHQKIIDIGAVILDRHTLEIKGKFNRLVNPEEEITQFITELTTITNEMVANEPAFPIVIKDFEDWVVANCKKLKNVRLSSFGVYFDSPLMRRCYTHYNLNYPFSGTWVDVKSVAHVWAYASGRKSDRFQQVSGCMDEMGLPKPEGFHRALVDAIAESQIYVKAMRDITQGHFLEPEHGQPSKYIRISTEECECKQMAEAEKNVQEAISKQG